MIRNCFLLSFILFFGTPQKEVFAGSFLSCLNPFKGYSRQRVSAESTVGQQILQYVRENPDSSVEGPIEGGIFNITIVNLEVLPSEILAQLPSATKELRFNPGLFASLVQELLKANWARLPLIYGTLTGFAIPYAFPNATVEEFEFYERLARYATAFLLLPANVRALGKVGSEPLHSLFDASDHIILANSHTDMLEIGLRLIDSSKLESIIEPKLGN